MSDEVIARLRAELDGLTGAARLVPLTKLGQALTQRLWRLGMGTPAVLTDLNDAIAVFTEAHGYMRDDDNLRGNVAALLGLLLGTRHSAYTNDERDCEHGTRMLEEALAWPNLAAPLRGMCRIQLGQLSIMKAMLVFQAPGAAMGLVTGSVPPGVAGEADRAVECFRQVLADPTTTEEMTEAAESMLAMAETVRTTVGSTGAAGLDLQRLMDAMAKMQKLRDRFTQGAGPGGFRGTGSFLAFSDIQSIVTMDPIDRPVPVMRAAAPVREPEPRVPVAPASADHDDLRRVLHGKLAGDGAAEPVWMSAAALLLPEAPTPDVDAIDELVALARMVVDETADEADVAAVDWFVLAVTLCLRDRVDRDGDRADRLAGAESLVTAVRTVPPGHPAHVVMLRSLGAFLDEGHPLGGALEVVAEEFADRLDAAITARVTDDPADLATLHALRCLCRTATAAAELGRAAVPPDYPWHTALRSASRIVG